jgi:hypothetical protein
VVAVIRVGHRYRFNAKSVNVFTRPGPMQTKWLYGADIECKDGDIVMVENVLKSPSDVVLRHANGERSLGWTRWFEICFDPLEDITIESVDQNQIGGPSRDEH